jgi:hypothetical protein
MVSVSVFAPDAALASRRSPSSTWKVFFIQMIVLYLYGYFSVPSDVAATARLPHLNSCRVFEFGRPSRCRTMQIRSETFSV